ncbi:MAG TPA: NFACT RNA binding domain-containing protein, partial [candidate division Zixibacteria bacterium]|nr:NFACT RNA binding domain-containing protein [candidate division Zixibacteria bacterium]
YPFKLSSVEQQPEKFKTLSLAVIEMSKRRQVAVEEEGEEKTIVEAVKRALKRTEKRITHIESDLEKAQDYEEYKKLGELIQINMSSIKKGMTEITVEDVYAEGKKITIELEQPLTPSENAEKYFKKYQKAREGLEQMQRRLEISKLELDNLREMEKALESDFENARNRYESELAELLPKEGAKTETFVRLPYKEYELKSGVKIFVGRDGLDNDRTTFEFAKPYELWFHTQQCAGSHTVLKFPHKSFEPSKREIEETAAIAAWFSKARNDTLVPVAYTQKKYVRKPRKAKPGLVTIEREKSVMVVPRKPEE